MFISWKYIINFYKYLLGNLERGFAVGLAADNPFCSAFRRKLGELGGGGAGWLGHLAQSCPEYQVVHLHLSTGS
jgi:hypothetical protein